MTKKRFPSMPLCAHCGRRIDDERAIHTNTNLETVCTDCYFGFIVYPNAAYKILTGEK